MPQLFGDKLRTLRQRNQLTQSALARLLPPTTRGHINNIEVGRKEPSLDFVVRVATLFQVRIEDLVDDAISGAALQPKQTQTLEIPADEPRRHLGEKLRHLRTSRRLTQAQLAQQLDLQTQAHISLLENGQSDLSLMLALKLARLFAVSVDYLVRDSVPVEGWKTGQRRDDQSQA